MSLYDRYEPDIAHCPLCGAALVWTGGDGPSCLLEWKQGRLAPSGQRVDPAFLLPDAERGATRLPARFSMTAIDDNSHLLDAVGEAPFGLWERTHLARLGGVAVVDLAGDYLFLFQEREREALVAPRVWRGPKAVLDRVTSIGLSPGCALLSRLSGSGESELHVLDLKRGESERVPAHGLSGVLTRRGLAEPQGVQTAEDFWARQRPVGAPPHSP